jgi:hypothetical protein
MRTYGRITNLDGSQTWVEVQSDSSGNFEYGYVTNLIQVLKLNLGESPFYANYGIPAWRSVVQQVFPDFYVNLVQQQFSPYFANLQISKVQSTTPTYNVNVILTNGTTIQTQVAV